MGQDGNATASFSGFLYQADIALLKALEKIENIGNDEKELRKWSLEVEGEEDFTLIEKNGEKVKKYLYQAKEYEEGTPGKYLDGVIKLYHCIISDINENVDCKTFICSKVKINIKNKNELIYKLKESENKDILFQKALCKLGIDELDKKVEEYLKYPYKGKEIVKKYFENDNVKKEEINKKFKENIEKTNFLDNFDFGDGKNEGFGSFENVKKNILGKIEEIRKILKLKNNINLDYFVRYWESKIKEFIQKRKKDESFENIKLIDIFNSLNKDGGEILDENVKEDFYKDMLINEFIKSFRKNFKDIYFGKTGYGKYLKKIGNEIGGKEKYNLFLNEIGIFFSEKIFDIDNKEKVLGLIKYTIGNKEFDKIEIKNLDNLLKKISYSNDRIERIIYLLISYFYARKNNLALKDNFFIGTNNFLDIEYNSKKGILTGLSNDEKHLKEFLQSNIFYRYEKSHIGIYGVDEYLYDFLGEGNDEEQFRKENKDIAEMHKNYKYDITKTLKTIIFSGENCLNEDGEKNAENFMPDEPK